MFDRDGKQLRVGYYVQYYESGEDEPLKATFMVNAIIPTNKGLDKYPPHDITGEPPYALLTRIADDIVIESPFFSHELGRIKLEDLI